MTKNAVVTLNIGKKYQELFKINKHCFENYAKKINADFIQITEQKISEIPQYEKFIIFDLLNKYERIIYLDQDIIIREDCPNLFDIVPIEKLGVFNEFPFVNRIGVIDNFAKHLNINCKEDNKYYNTGVMIISKNHQSIFEKPIKEINDNFYEQTYLNIKMRELDYIDYKDKIYELDPIFNRMTCVDGILGKSRLDSYIVHYAGCPNIDFMYSIIAKDLKQWDIDKPEYKYPMNIFIQVSGGLGDQVCSKPSIIELRENIYPDANIIIETHYPYLFNDIDVKCYKHGEYVSNFENPHYKMQSFPDTKSALFSLLSTMECNLSDYCSIALLKRILPMNKKNIKLPYDETKIKDLLDITKLKNIDDLKNMILIHAGKNWETKTFPSIWWEKIINGLIEKNVKVCLIGKNGETDDETGVVKVNIPSNAINTIDLLNLPQLITLIGTSKILLSNDSSPIHIAGAFDNWIYLIPSIKHPDHILPFRKGSLNYKSQSLYKKLVIDDFNIKPNMTKDIVMDKMNNDWDNYLLEPDEIVEIISKKFFEIEKE
jgi:ADP-heptose:LPS heptosyltransferase